MIVVVYGFPNKQTALMFEHAWQHPTVSRHTKRKKMYTTKENKIGYECPAQANLYFTKIRALYDLLTVKPFSRWPLKLRFSTLDHQSLFLIEGPPIFIFESSASSISTIAAGETTTNENFTINRDNRDVSGITDDRHQIISNKSHTLPTHIEITHGPIKDLISLIHPLKHLKDNDQLDIWFNSLQPILKCYLCTEPIEKKDMERYICCNGFMNCNMIAHLTCLAKHFLSAGKESPDTLVPIEGKCPLCMRKLLWGDLIHELRLRIVRFTQSSSSS
ncbi:unnamed protein product [Cunninghamella blakesleeana]